MPMGRITLASHGGRAATTETAAAAAPGRLDADVLSWPAMRPATIAILAGLCGCVEPPVAAADRVCGLTELATPLLVLEANGASALARVADGCVTGRSGDVGLGGDVELSESAGRYFVHARAEGTVNEIDPVALEIILTVPAAAAGDAPANPHDVAVDGLGRLWIARYELPSVAVVEPGAGVVGTVDLGALDPDGVPEMEAIRIVGDRAYVILERLDRKNGWLPHGPAKVAVIDTETLTLIDSFELAGQNPFRRMSPVPGEPGVVAVATPGDFYALSAADGVTRVDLAAGVSELVVSELELDGSAVEAIIAGPTEGYAIVMGLLPDVDPTRVIAFNPSTGAVGPTLVDSREGEAGFYHAGLALNGPHLVVGDRTPEQRGLLVFERSSGLLVGSIPAHRQPPFSLLSLPE